MDNCQVNLYGGFAPASQDRGGTVQIFGQPDGNERQLSPAEKRSQPVPPDDGASPHDPG